MYTDASQHSLGAVLVQVQNGSERTICCASESFSRTQRSYSTTKRELLAIVNFTSHFKHYLLGRKFHIVTAHRVLQWLHNFKGYDGLTARWFEKLETFECEIVHCSEKKATDTRTLRPRMQIKLPPWTRRMHLRAVQTQSIQHTLTTKQVTQNDQTVLALAKNQSLAKRSKRSQNRSNSISVREIMNKREVQKILTSCR